MQTFDVYQTTADWDNVNAARAMERVDPYFGIDSLDALDLVDDFEYGENYTRPYSQPPIQIR